MRDLRVISKLKPMEEKRVKKLCLILALALVLVGAFSAVAFAQTGGPIPQLDPTVDRQHPDTDPTVNAHSGFTINGDTCSACHSMHYAGNGFNLTLAVSDYAATSDSAACLACHDGTTGNYNVIAGENGVKEPAMGGLFANYASTDPNGSQHDAFGTVEAYIAAPGGKGSNLATGVTYDAGTWKSGQLSCGSCHEAHIAINPRLLSINPNGIMDDKVVTDENAVQADGTTVQNYVDNTTKYYFKKAPGAVDPENEVGIIVKVGGVELKYIKDYQIKWGTKLSAPNTRNDAGGNLADTGHGAKPGLNSQFNEDYAWVEFTKTDLASGAEVQLSYKPAFKVQMKINKYNQAGENVQYGKGMESFCTACHTDFFGSKQKKDANGVSITNKGYFGGLAHHTGDRPNEGIAVLGNYTDPANIPAGVTGEDQLKYESVGSCLTCHFAHGVNKARWAQVSTAAGYNNPDGTPIYNVDEKQANSAANKRLPNTAMCVLCHDMVSGAGSGESSK